MSGSAGVGEVVAIFFFVFETRECVGGKTLAAAAAAVNDMVSRFTSGPNSTLFERAIFCPVGGGHTHSFGVRGCRYVAALSICASTGSAPDLVLRKSAFLGTRFLCARKNRIHAESLGRRTPYRR